MADRILRRDWMKGSAAAGLAVGLRVPVIRAAQVQGDVLVRSFDTVHFSIPLSGSAQDKYEAWLVKVHTSIGVTGLAEVTVDPRLQLERMVGRSLWSFLYRRLDGVECAVYDIVAQIAGIPLARLFASGARRQVPVGCRHHTMSVERSSEHSYRRTYRRFRVHVIESRLLKEAVPGRSIDFARRQVVVDGRENLTGPAGALHFVRRLQDRMHLTTLLDPLRQIDLPTYRDLRRDLPVQLALRWKSAHARNFLMESLADAFLVESSGPYNAEAGICELAGLGSWLEIPVNAGVLFSYYLHQAAALPGLELLILQRPEPSRQIAINIPEISMGVVDVPEKSGLGIELDEGAIAEFRNS